MPNRGDNSGPNVLSASFHIYNELRPRPWCCDSQDLERGTGELADVVFAAIFMNMLSSQAAAGATCENLASLSLPDTTITLAQTVA